MSVQARIFTMKAWIQRRRAKGEEPTADEIWKRIHENWPTATAIEKNSIFEGAN